MIDAAEHPGEDDLVGEPLHPEVLRHLETCAKCRIQRRELAMYLASDVALPEGLSAGLPLRVLDEIARDAESVPSGPEGEPDSMGERRLIGRGERGLVYSAFDQHLQRRVALKIVHGVPLERLQTAMARLDRIRHPCLAPFLEIVPGKTLAVKRKLFDGDDFAHAVATARRARILDWVSQVASGLAALHLHGGAHGGLCPENLRVEASGRVTVVDAGLGGLPERSPWRAPELGPEEASAAGDWYALGRILQRHAPQLADGARTEPMTVASLCERMCASNPALRPTGAEVVAILLLEVHPEGPGTQRYEIRELVQSGGMGEVLRAWDPVARRDVAFKRMKPEAARTADGGQRFRNEARIGAQLQHPSIVPVYEVGTAGDLPYFTMKLIQGSHLGKVIRDFHEGRGTWTLPTLIEAFLRVCEAVSYAHSRGVVHLDLKPHNVMVGEYGEVHLLDWGLARLLGGAQSSVSVDAGVPIPRAAGTRAYMAPEQAEGRVEDLGPHTDVYALGVILAEILTGRPAASAGERATHLPELAAVAAKAREGAPGRRYASAEDLRRDVDAWRSGARVSAYPYTRLELATRWVRPYLGYAALGAASLLGVGVVAAFGWAARIEANRSHIAEEVGAARRLVDQSMLLLAAGDRVEAEQLAVAGIRRAAAVGHGLPEARGILVRIGRTPFPRRVASCTTSDLETRCETPEGPVSHTAGDDGTTGSDGDRAWVLREGVRSTSEPFPGAVAATWPCGAGAIVRLADHETLLWTPGQPDFGYLGPTARDAPLACDLTGARLAFASEEQIAVWTTHPLQQRTSFAGHEDLVRGLAWSRDGATLASASDDGTLRLWDTRRPWTDVRSAEIARLPLRSDFVAFLPGPARLLAGGDAPTLWDLSATGVVGRIDAMVGLRRSGWLGADLGTLDRHGNLRAWSAALGRPAPRAATDEVVDFTSSRDGNTVITLAPGGTVTAVGAAGASPLWSGSDPGATTLASSERWVATGGPAGVEIRATTEGKPIARWETGPVAAIQLVDDTAYVRTTDQRLEVRVAPGGALQEQRDAIAFAHADATGRWLLFSDAQGTVLRDGNTSAPLVAVGASAAAFSADGTLLAVAADDRTVRIFGLPERSELARVTVDLRRAASLSFAADDRSLAVSGADNVAEIWGLAPLRATVAELESDWVARYGSAGGGS